MTLLTAEAVEVDFGEGAAQGQEVAERVVEVTGDHLLVGVGEGSDVPISVRMVIRMGGWSGGVLGHGQEAADAAGAFEAQA